MELPDQEITKLIIASAFKVHNTPGSGSLERVYQNALAIELRSSGLKVDCEIPITVRYAGEPAGEYFADLLVENRVICELKAANAISPGHEAQLGNYLAATGLDTGLLLNFARSVTVKRKFREFRSEPERNPVNPENPVNPV